MTIPEDRKGDVIKMKEKIYTIPLMDAVRSGDECPFCFIERQLEQRVITFILGSAYMEEDIRKQTDKIGFCRQHYKMMFDYGNQLGNALMLKTHLAKLCKELKLELKTLSPKKSPLLSKFKKTAPEDETRNTSIGNWTRAKENSCYVCNHFKDVYPRYVDTFFEMIKNDEVFYKLVENGKGFCLPHFGDLMEAAPDQLNGKHQERFYSMIGPLMEKHIERLYEDVSWFVEKNDYRFKDADWKDSRDAVQRGMQKVAGGHPADPVFMSKR